MNSSSSPSTVPPRTVRAGKPGRTIGFAVVLLAMVVAGLWFWRVSRGGPPEYAPPGAIDVVAATLVAEPAPVSLEALGSLRAVRQVTLSSEAAGRVAAILFEPGQRTAAGAVLVQLDDATEQADLAAAQANAAFAQQQLARATELVASGAVSAEQLQQRQAEQAQTAALVAQLETRIRKMAIRAPFAGELGLRRIDLGQYLNPGDAVATLTDPDELYVNFDVPQQELSRLRVGLAVEVGSDAAGAAPRRATISAIEPQVGTDTRNATVQARLANPDRALHSGMYVTVAVQLPPEPEALLVPATAIVTSPSGDMVAVVRDLTPPRTGRTELVPVTAGRRIGDRIVVTRGLQAGAVVVTEGQLRLQPGAAVQIVQKPSPEAAGQPDSTSAAAGK